MKTTWFDQTASVSKVPSESPPVLEIEKESLRLLEVAGATEKEMEELYPRMVEESESAELLDNAESLKRATSNIARAWAQIYRISDEFHARLKDIQKQKKRKS